MKFKFVSQFQGFGSPTHTLEFEVDQLADVISYFEQFLRGSGYHFEGQLDFVNDFDDAPSCQCDCSCDSDPNVIVDEDDDRPVNFLLEKCNVRGCGLTRQQLGEHTCYDPNCGFKN